MEQDLIKDSSLIIPSKSSTGNAKRKVYTLKNTNTNSKQTRLSDVFNFLPNGLIHKHETGMGATTLEILAERNSIIVEPLKITASSKAFIHRIKHHTFYVGSPTKYHKTRASDKNIKDYIEDKSIQYKKILVVADSLPKLIKLIGEDVYNNYFLLIDEIDSFQLDSTYRSKMEECIDVYKKFISTKNCAMVSATILNFTDKVLKAEPKTEIKYAKVYPKSITVIYSRQSVELEALHKIKAIHTANKTDKIFVAYNSVSGCYDLADECRHELSLQRSDIRILCGKKSNENKVGVRDYFHELNDTVLPAKLNFATSAYFTGFDIEEGYHLIVLSSVGNYVTPLSAERIKQIAGRCRATLRSITAIHDFHKYTLPKNIELHTADYLIDIAKKEKTALNCIESNFGNDDFLKSNIQDIRALITQQIKFNGHQLVWINSEGEAEVSYLSIDAFLENERVNKLLYNGYFNLKNSLKPIGFKVTHVKGKLRGEIQHHDINKLDRQARIEHVLAKVQELEDGDNIRNFGWYSELDSFQKDIADVYDENRYYATKEELFTLMSESLVESTTNKAFNTLKAKLKYSTANSKDYYKSIVESTFEVGKTYSKEELKDLWNNVFHKASFNEHITNSNIIVDLTKLHFITERTKRREGKQSINVERIISPIPLEITIHKQKPKEQTLDLDVFFKQVGM